VGLMSTETISKMSIKGATSVSSSYIGGS
jgi:hypothetical protein